MQAIMNMRAGLRRRNIDLIVSAKAAYAPLFRSRNHPKYRDLEILDAVQRSSVPKELEDFFNETESVSLNGDPNTGEGLDFKAEVVNKDVQSWMPRGVPDGGDWLRVTHNLEKLKKLSQKSKELFGLKQRQSGSSPHDLSEQVTAWRARVRERQYLLSPCDISKKHTSVDGRELDDQLVNFQENAITRKQDYFDAKFGSQETATDEAPLIFVTKEERADHHRIENLSKSKIVEKIANLLESVEDEDYRKSLFIELNEYKTKLSQSKRDILLYNKVNDVLKSQDISSDINMCVFEEVV